MHTEIERKFLVDTHLWNQLKKPEGNYLKQCYLSTDPERTVRVRIYGDKGFITIKGKMIHLTRPEYEYEIPVKDASDMIDQLGNQVIEKTRYCIPLNEKTWEVDVFHGENEGLIIAEVELESEVEKVTLPDWVKEEVSTDPKYFNANLQSHPFTQW